MILKSIDLREKGEKNDSRNIQLFQLKSIQNEVERLNDFFKSINCGDRRKGH